MDGFDRSEPRFDEQFYFALIAETRQHATVSSGIRTGEQQASRFTNATSKSISLRSSAVTGESKATLARAVR